MKIVLHPSIHALGSITVQLNQITELTSLIPWWDPQSNDKY